MLFIIVKGNIISYILYDNIYVIYYIHPLIKYAYLSLLTTSVYNQFVYE